MLAWRLTSQLCRVVAVQLTPTGADFADALHCFPVLPNVELTGRGQES